ncbi:putative DNA primase large subunit [Auxenochlorella protothecoides]|uniref:DNA primase large subunit n=1 Tax=Auxenochlorella protothecoides TaxID=3075 RepID=A0A087SMD0_AUXPR|nr:putative DNA primase large subunit [Auxenochlorella protothecoides]KFM26884.1 putative DNA primase large subunit [Auxenochlorella protothecoides]RMZ52221.1 hypothetical protein APUTEX25_001611 [Auxenochlorella protothecoides]|eukprot:RMZ52221.1 hypothetical protein APUTEX25_001611 [Auxenochlorella protothecoides]
MVGWVLANSVGAPALTPSKEGLSSEPGSKHALPSLSMYSELPGSEISIEEFEQAALDRLRVLKGLDDLKAKGFRPDQVQDKVLSLVDQYLKAATRESTIRKDTVSHYVLRLAYCRTEELRRWFLAQECDLFRARFRALLPGEQRAFIEGNRLPFRPLTPAEFREVEDDLRATMLAVTGSLQQTNALFQGAAAPHEAFYRAPFEAVPDLVGSRRVYLRAGHAYVSRDQAVSLAVQPFRAALSKALVTTARRWSQVVGPSEAHRLAPIVESLSQRYLGPDYSDPEKRGVTGQVAASDIPRLAQESFPLCMQVMAQALHESHHLKHDGRMQLGLFLKGIGLPLEEAVRFWRAEMAATAPGEKFDKEFLYNVRHNYGKEGNRRDYTPYTCSKIIASVPGVGQVHGCPFRTFGPDALRSAISRLQVTPAKVDEACAKAKAGHFQLACAAVWEGKHGCSCETGINHPNQYFEESQKVLHGEQQPGGPGLSQSQGVSTANPAPAGASPLPASVQPHTKHARVA